MKVLRRLLLVAIFTLPVAAGIASEKMTSNIDKMGAPPCLPGSRC